jgi:hypothetical protein
MCCGQFFLSRVSEFVRCVPASQAGRKAVISFTLVNFNS